MDRYFEPVSESLLHGHLCATVANFSGNATRWLLPKDFIPLVKPKPKPPTPEQVHAGFRFAMQALGKKIVDAKTGEEIKGVYVPQQ